MVNDIAQKIAGCQPCVSQLPSLPFEPLLSDSASFPMQKVATDLFDHESISYIVMVDRFSGFP